MDAFRPAIWIDGVSSDRYRAHGAGQRQVFSRERRVAGARIARVRRWRCVDHAEHALGEYVQLDHDDRRESIGDDPGPATAGRSGRNRRMTQQDRAKVFRALHDAPEAFVIANAWDAGSAKLLTALGFKALATSSGAQAGILGRVDGKVTRDEALAHAKAIVEASDLPVSADLEKGFGDSPDDAARTITLAASVGLVGGSIEDASGGPAHPLYG